MCASHAHGSGTDRRAGRRRLAVVLAIALVVLAVELTGALLAGSVALLADAAHVATDAAGVGLALFAVTMASRPGTPERTFGWQRLEVLAAAVNAAVLLAVAALVLVEAVGRLRSPGQVQPGVMLVAAGIGLVANAGAVAVLRPGRAEGLNLRAAYLEVLADLLASAAVVVAALVVLATGFTRADAVAGVAIAVAIVPRTWRLLREAVEVLLEAAPRGVDLRHVREHVLAVPGVVDVHDLHAWTITSGLPVLSAHVVVEQDALAQGHGGRVLDALGTCLSGHFDVAHCTFQLEPAGHREHEHRAC